jgi:hypothetical protein
LKQVPVPVKEKDLRIILILLTQRPKDLSNNALRKHELYPRSGIRKKIIPDPGSGSRSQISTGYRTRISNTACCDLLVKHFILIVYISLCSNMKSVNNASPVSAMPTGVFATFRTVKVIDFTLHLFLC